MPYNLNDLYSPEYSQDQKRNSSKTSVIHPLICRGRRKDSGKWKLCRRKQGIKFPPTDIFIQGVHNCRSVVSLVIFWENHVSMCFVNDLLLNYQYEGFPVKVSPENILPFLTRIWNMFCTFRPDSSGEQCTPLVMQISDFWISDVWSWRCGRSGFLSSSWKWLQPGGENLTVRC